MVYSGILEKKSLNTCAVVVRMHEQKKLCPKDLVNEPVPEKTNNLGSDQV